MITAALVARCGDARLLGCESSRSALEGGLSETRAFGGMSETQTSTVSHSDGTTISTNSAFVSVRDTEPEAEAGNHAFFIIGAPTTQTVADLKMAFDRHGLALTLFIEADLKTYMKQVGSPGPNVYSMPTNLRAPYQYRPGVPGEASQPIVMGDVQLDSFAAYMECQRMVSQSVLEILEFARLNGLPTFFPIVARKQRPTHIQVSPDGDQVVALPPDEGPRASHPGSDQELSAFALKVLVEPASFKAGRALLEDLKRCTDHNATYLADVLAIIGAAKMVASGKWWERWSLASCDVHDDGTHSKVIFGDKDATEAAKNVPYCKAEFVSDPAGQFYSMDSTTPSFDKAEFNGAVREMLESHASGSPTPIWDTCYVAHDSFALDVDDLPALELAKGVTAPGGFRDAVTWRESNL